MHVRVGSLFSGIGGFDLAARWLGWRTEWFSEIDPYASRVLAKHWPDVPNLGDITKISYPPTVDILVGGFPCQDISLIGKGAGLGGARSGLWTEYARLIGETRPRFCVIENVSALRTRGLLRVLRDLDALGYDAEWHCIPAAYVGAPHRRDRIWIVATRRVTYASECIACPDCGDPFCEWHDEHYADCACAGPHMADPIGAGLEGYAGDGKVEGGAFADRPARAPCLRLGEDASRWWATESNVGRVGHGIPNRVDRLKCLGNAVVPWLAMGVLDNTVNSVAY